MSRTSILIIDDDKLDRYLLTRDLTRAEFEPSIYECEDAIEGLKFLENFEPNKASHGDDFPPQIILLDINMPRLSGFGFLDAFTELRNTKEEYGRCVVLMVSSSEHPEERERALNHDLVADFVIKGRTSAEELCSKISEALVS